MQKYERITIAGSLQVYVAFFGAALVCIWWMVSNNEWAGGNRAYFNPENPLKDVCSKCGGWNYIMTDGMPKPCKECESKGFIMLASTLAAITVAGFKKIRSKH